VTPMYTRTYRWATVAALTVLAIVLFFSWD
jgi:hypothetical protein